MKEEMIGLFSAIYEDILTGTKASIKENDILDMHDRILYVTMYSGHSNYITRRGNNPKLDPYADYDHAFIDLFDDDVYSVVQGYDMAKLKEISQL